MTMAERTSTIAEGAFTPIVLRSILLGVLAFAAGPVHADSAASDAAPSKAAPAASAKPGASPPAPKNLEPIAPESVVAVLGRKVSGPAGEDMGTVVDVLVDGDGKPKAVVIDFGGFLGVGSRKIAVDWRLLQFRPADPKKPLVLSLGRAAVQAAPEYQPAKNETQPAEMVGPPPRPASSDAKR